MVGQGASIVRPVRQYYCSTYVEMWVAAGLPQSETDVEPARDFEPGGQAVQAPELMSCDEYVPAGHSWQAPE
jgi:hypothetical protein